VADFFNTIQGGQRQHIDKQLGATYNILLFFVKYYLCRPVTVTVADLAT
jgi:hypothetical protein